MTKHGQAANCASALTSVTMLPKMSVRTGQEETGKKVDVRRS